MSGGHYDYAYCKMNMFADDLELDVECNGGEYTTLSPEVKELFTDLVEMTRHCAKLAREAEWHMSGDTGDDTCVERMRAIMEGMDES